jgi:response regulator RpfG family c-di-GMP phosphodiesterase
MPAASLVSGKTVTLVDDEEMVLDMLVRAAQNWHYDCQAATSAEEALQLFEKRPTPLLVTDLDMPGRGGVWLVREVRRRWPKVAIIVITAGRDSDAAIDCLNSGAHRYFLKPIRLDEFRHALQTTLATYHLERNQERYQRRLERTVRRQTGRIRSTFLSAIDSLIRAMEACDPYTTGHTLRVRHYALRLADAIGLEPRQRKYLSLAAKLHDIGKVGVPEAILNKPASLTPEEFRQVQAHPAIGERIVAPIIRNPAVLAAIRGHHEHLDGGGYPDGLAGPDIPLLARLITIPDCFDALTSARAYRDALPLAQAVDILRAGSGKLFDPTLVKVFIDLAPTLLPSNLRAASLPSGD